ncbi:MAG: beta-propeller domain-containing protein [Paenibacillaceae bacterium]
MKKWLLYPALVSTLLFSFIAFPTAPVIAAGLDSGYTFTLDGKPLIFTVQPHLVHGTMMVPYRAIAEAMGVQIIWNEAQHSIIATKDEVTLVLKINDIMAKRNQDSIRLAAAPIIVNGTSLIPLRFFSEAFGSVVKWNGITKKITIENESTLLPVVGTYKNLQVLLAKFPSNTIHTMDMLSKGEATKGLTAPAESTAIASTAGASNDYSTTNVQVQGVDEADIVKTDGQYIYQVNKQRIIIAKASPAEQLSIVTTLPFTDQSFTPTEIYLDDTRLVVIGTSYAKMGYNEPTAIKSEAKRLMPIRNPGSVKAIQYDTRDKASIKKVREIELEGRYVTSRKIGASLYLIANQNVNTYSILNDKAEISSPIFRDTAVSDESFPIGYEHLRYFPQSIQPNYLLIAAVNLDQPGTKANVEAYLGSSQNVFASEKNLYVALTQYRQTNVKMPIASDGPSTSIALPLQETNSRIYKFLLDQDKVRFSGSGEVSGTVLNQYAMDEYSGYFRIATTSGEAWRNDKKTSKNNVYLLNEAMEITGKIENIAPGERIYSTRFIGNRAYMVTFKQVDPLFVIDLTHPQAPKILGSLKIPGYSDYLHPYDENHIIGFGKDTVEVSNSNSGISGNSSTTAFYQGMKIVMFDVTDVSHPIEMFKESIGDRGTDSEMLHNPKALLFNKEKGLMAFPVTLIKIDPNSKISSSINNPSPAYGQFAYQGAYVYHVDLTNGFKLKGTITHLNQDDLAKAGGNWYYSDKSINRIIYIGNTLFTLSNAEIKANDMNSMEEINTLMIP